MLVVTVEDDHRVQHQELEVAGISSGRQVARYTIDGRVGGGERLRVPQQLEPAQASDGFELAIGVHYEPANRLFGFAGRIRNVDLPVPDLPFAINRIAALQGRQDVV